MPIGDGKARDEVKGINQEIGFILDAITSIGDKLVTSFETAVDSAGDLGGAVDVVGKTVQRGLVADLKSAVKSTENLINLSAKLTRGTLTQKDIAKEQERIAFNRAKLDAKRQTFGNRLTKKQQELLALEEAELDAQEKTLNNIEEENNKLQQQKGIFQLLQENSAGLANKIDKSGQLAKILSGNVGLLFTPLRLAELAIIGIVEAFREADKQTIELANSLGFSYNEAATLRGELQNAANLSGDLTITGKGLAKALMASNKELGVFNTTIDDNLVLFEKLHKTAGLTYEELSGIKSIADATGGDLELQTKELLGQARLTADKFGVALNEAEVMKEIKDVSKATTVSLGMSTAELANAVSTAKALGFQLSEIEGIAGNLLDFESSITKELEAELLLGRDLNLEKARQFALDNNLAGVAEEIAKNVGTAADFAKMNRLEQDAIAAAAGTNREELAKSLFIREQIGNLTGEEYELRKQQIEKLEAQGLSQEQIKKKLGEQSLADLKAQNGIQEQLNKTTEKLKETFASIAIPLMQIIEPILKILTPAIAGLAILLSPLTEGFSFIATSVSSLIGLFQGTNTELSIMQGIVGGIVVAYGSYLALSKGIMVIQGITKGIQAARLGLQAKSNLLESKGLVKTVGTAIFNAVASFNKIPPPVGFALGLTAAAGIASMAAKYLTANDFAQKGGYGKRMMFSPEGTIAFNDNDDILAGTNLFNQRSAPAVSKSNEEAKETNRLLKSILQKQGTVKMDSTQVGTSFTVNSYQLQ